MTIQRITRAWTAGRVVVSVMLACSTSQSVNAVGGNTASRTAPWRADGVIDLRSSPQSAEDCRRNAEQGDSEAMLQLALRYERGSGVPKDAGEAFVWLGRASEAGNIEARIVLAWRLANGHGAPKDLTKSAQLYRQAAERGDAVAQLEYGLATALGQGVVKDEGRAHEYLLKAAEQGNAAAQSEVGYDFEVSRGTMASDVRAVEWYRKSALQECADGQWRLGRMIKRGRGATSDPDAGLKWILKAAFQGHEAAQWDAAMMYKNGDGIRQKMNRAAHWLGKLAEVGHREGQIELAAFAPRKYVKIARRLTLRRGTITNTPGSAVQAAGWIKLIDGSTWTLTLDTPRGTVAVDGSRLAGARVREGQYVRLCGMLDAAFTIEALLHEVPEPTYKYSFEVTAPGGVTGGKRSSYTVVGTVTNTGKQPIRSLVLNVRLYQLQSPNDETEVVTLEYIRPGERRRFTARFRFYNFLYIGQTSYPRGQVTERSIDW